MQKELDSFKKSESLECAIFEKKLNEVNKNFKTLEKENVILRKYEIIRLNHEFEKEIEKIKDFEKIEFKKLQLFETEMLKIETKIRELKNENMDLKMKNIEKRDSTISCCSKLINENNLLKSKINKLELVTQKFFTRNKSL